MTTNKIISKFELPTEAERQAMWEAELVRRLSAGEYLSAEDKREARKLSGGSK